jgi:aspartate aminotransferase-like enzyme
MSFLSVSERAMEITRSIGYAGYDAILPFENAQRDHYFPNTPYWHGVAALNAGAEMILKEGLENSFARHADVARFCREYLVDLGLTLYPDKHAVPAPTVTAVNVPEKIEWASSTGAFGSMGWWWAAATARSPARSSAWGIWAARHTWNCLAKRWM